MNSIVNVVNEGICVGCGACKVATQGAIPIRLTPYGAYQAKLENVPAQALATGSKVCPFSNESLDEDAIARGNYDNGNAYDQRIGYFTSLYAGRRNDAPSIHATSSGGLTSWITERLLEAGEIDGVIHVGTSMEDDRLFSYQISSSMDDIRARRKSQYYSVTFADVLLAIQGDGKRYALIGVPCFIKAARLVCEQDETLKKQLRFFIALVCGHMKTSSFAELLAWQTGVAPKELAKVDFRVKVENKPTPDYKFSAWGTGDPQAHTRPTRDMQGGNWGHATFQLRACDFCDDIWGETADVALGDAWLPAYVKDWRGTNVLVTRHPLIEKLLKDGLASGAITLDTLDVAQIASSQDGNYRHRWDGLSVRLADAQRAGRWTPRKRIMANSRPVGLLRRRIVRLRETMARESHELFQRAKAQGSLEVFTNGMAPYVRKMQLNYRLLNPPTPGQVWRKILKKLGVLPVA